MGSRAKGSKELEAWELPTELMELPDDLVWIQLTRLEAGVLTDSSYEGTDEHDSAIKKIIAVLIADR